MRHFSFPISFLWFTTINGDQLGSNTDNLKRCEQRLFVGWTVNKIKGKKKKVANTTWHDPPHRADCALNSNFWKITEEEREENDDSTISPKNLSIAANRYQGYPKPPERNKTIHGRSTYRLRDDNPVATATFLSCVLGYPTDISG